MATAAALSQPPEQKPEPSAHPPAELTYLPPLLSRLPSALIVSSPTLPRPVSPDVAVGYTTSHLPFIDPASLALHHALLRFRAVSSEYSNLPYEQAFNWPDLVIPPEIEREWSAHFPYT